jgi:integrase
MLSSQKPDGSPDPRRRFRVLPLTLDTGEILPTLVYHTFLKPVRVATRWVVRRRRWRAMPSTLTNDLRSIGLLYSWANRALERDLDDLLEDGEPVTGVQIQDLLAFLRVGGHIVNIDRATISACNTVARHASVIRDFLKWAVDPASQGRSQIVPFDEIRYQRACLDEAFHAATRQTGASQRIRPLTDNEVTRIDRLIGPRRKDDGCLIVPLQFPPENPFRMETRLRNWLMYGIAIQCGLRRGELLKLRLDDLPRPDSPGLKVRRRAHDLADSRRHRPGVKTVERVLDISGELRAGVRAYLTGRQPAGRPSGRSPYLFVTSVGRALSINAANEVVGIIARNAQIDDLSWHSFRHTWAEALAEELLKHHAEEDVLGLLRTLGGWKPRSTMPLHYTQNALARRANEFLRKRNDRLYVCEAERS